MRGVSKYAAGAESFAAHIARNFRQINASKYEGPGNELG
jgi:hypothetical protein